MTDTERERLLPTGSCWCGCERHVGLGKFFAQGHDKIAEAAYVAVHHEGSIPRLLADTGFGPGGERSIRQAALEDTDWRECPRGCGYAGAPASITKHVRKYHQKEN
ncbi:MULTISPECIES: hypothetical protein [unclassified Streptomyces]|uniref:hypothetical protein n=1 Tax=unclassified Streptomyces TaxID=2593676 RepID=UPI00332AA60C